MKPPKNWTSIRDFPIKIGNRDAMQRTFVLECGEEVVLYSPVSEIVYFETKESLEKYLEGK